MRTHDEVVIPSELELLTGVVIRAVLPTDASSVWSFSGAAPSQFRLGQSVPNPARGGARIAVEVPRQSSVELAVFDVSGRHVRTLLQGVRAPGTYQAVWDGRDERGQMIHSGVYFYRLRAPGFESTRSLQIIR
jgi:hypothetical protein